MLWLDQYRTVLDMTLRGSAVICAVLALRIILNKAPRAFSYALWLAVLFRLLCPVSLSAPVGLLPEPQQEHYAIAEPRSELADEPEAAQASDDETIVTIDLPHVRSAERTAVSALQVVWPAGVGAMLLYALAQYLRLRRRLVGAVPAEDGAWSADHITTPFVLGVLRPKIYLPSSLAESERDYVLAHERHHIKRGDPIWRLLAYAALCLHWFNPLVWLAFFLSQRDMELSCDEAVTRGMDSAVRAAYSESLLRFTTGRELALGAPLAFGEVDTKERIVHVMKYKKPALWVSVIAALLCLGTLTAFAFNAEKKAESELTAREALDALETSVRWEGENNVYFTIPEGYAPVSDWNIHIAGRAVTDDGMSMSAHFYDEENWEAGREYAIWLGDLTALIMSVSLPDEDGTVRERVIDLLPESEGPVFSARELGWEADLDGDGTAERIVLDVGLLEANAFSVPWIEAADGTKLCELDPVGSPHSTWNTYALTELDGKTYLLEYRPAMATGVAEYSYWLWSLEDGQPACVEMRGVQFPTYEPMTDEQIDAVAAFARFANALWAHSRLLFTTDATVARGLVQPDGRQYVTDVPVICGKNGGPGYVETLSWIDDELSAVGLSREGMDLREKLEEYRAYAAQR